ncbi:MAG: TonB-dependent receptor [Vicinamibacteria bacterium]
MRLVARDLFSTGIAAWMLLSAAPGFAAGTLFVTIVGRGEATLTLTAPDGTAVTHKTATGQAFLSPKSAGAHKLKVDFAGQSEETSVAIPTSGQVQAVFDPSQKPMITVYVSAVEEVSVTSQRVEENLQRVPLAVTAISARDLDVGLIQNVQKIAYQTPNLYMETNTGISSGGRAAIRGVGEDESFFSADTPVGIYVDDIYIPRQTGAMFDLYDLDRVEVLRGPQGTLYGRNTTAGAIRLISKEPGNQWRAHLEGTLGEYGRADFKGSLNAPLGDRAAFQAAGLRRKRDGYDTDAAAATSGRKLNDQDLWAGRASLRLLPGEKWNILLVGDLVRDRSQPAFAVAFRPQPPVLNNFGIGPTDITQQLDGDSNIHTLQSDLANPLNDLDQTGFHGSISYEISPTTTLKYIGGYRDMSNVLLLDADGRVGNFIGTPNPTFHLYQDQDQSQHSHEIQLQGRPSDRFRYIVGSYFFHEENAQRTENLIFAPLGRNNYWDVDLTTNSRAGFATLSWTPDPRWSVNLGGRYTSDSKKFNTIIFNFSGVQLQHCQFPNGTYPTGTRACNAADPAGSRNVPVEKHLDDTFDAFTPAFSLNYQAKPELLLYGSARRGFKSGGYDGRANTGFGILTLGPVLSEDLWSYEGGLKSDVARNRLRLNVAAFYNDWKDLQGTGTDPAGNFYRTTLGDVYTKGVELEVKAAPARGLDLTASLAFLRTGYESVTFNQQVLCGSLGTGGRELELKFSPRTSYYLGASYTTANFGSGAASGHFSLGGSVTGKDDMWNTSCNADTGRTEAYTLVDAYLAYETSDGRWRISANGENLSDEKYITGSFAIAGLRMSAGYFNPPRRLSVTLRYSYN